MLDQDRSEEYVIHRPKNLPFDLAHLAPLHGFFDTREVPSFVRRYGLLWHGTEKIERGQVRESLSEWKKAAQEMSFFIEQYRKLSEAIRINSIEPVRGLIKAFSTEVQLKAYTEEDYLGQLSILLAEQLTTHLEECTVGVVAAAGLNIEDDSPGRFMVAHHPPNLVSAAYAQLAVYVASQAELNECPGCGRIFRPETGRQKYCVPSCANATRWRRWKGRQAE